MGHDGERLIKSTHVSLGFQRGCAGLARLYRFLYDCEMKTTLDEPERPARPGRTMLGKDAKSVFTVAAENVKSCSGDRLVVSHGSAPCIIGGTDETPFACTAPAAAMRTKPCIEDLVKSPPGSVFLARARESAAGPWRYWSPALKNAPDAESASE